MRICLISWYAGALNEGAMATAFHLTEELSQRHQILHFNVNKVFSPSFWKEVRNFQPQIVHYIPGRSTSSFVITKTLALWSGRARTITSALFPISSLTRRLVPYLKPDLILTQSLDTERIFAGLGCKTKFLPSGVDTKKFTPTPQELKADLRKKYELDREKFTILHVGHIAEGRGVGWLGEVSKMENCQVILAINPSLKAERHLLKRLKANGCIIWNTYFKDIEEVYGLSDCYLFPAPRGSFHAVELPLSVMEAMSCNLPVVSTRFGALPRVFTEGNGLFFTDTRDGLFQRLEAVRNGVEVRTRNNILPYSWKQITQSLEGIYRELIGV